ncbi:angelicin synthase-like [Apium graveolens]|uniref:angelicin synthase-like n=1 Tax=Apium graveolens TaxID=4045 RepID=UPI003D791AA4
MAMVLELYPCFVAFFVLFFVTFFVYGGLIFKKEVQPPSPPKFPIIGNLRQLAQNKHITLRSWAHKYGPMMLIHMGSKPTLVVSSVAGAREILKTQDLVFSNKFKTSIARKIFYNGKDVALASYSEYWRQVKSLCVLQLLNNKRIQSFRNVRDEEVALLIQDIKYSSSKVVNLKKLFATLTFNIVCRVTVGKKYQGGKEAAFKKLLGQLSGLLSYSGVGIYVPWLHWVENFSGFSRRVEKVAKELDDFLEGVVEDHIIAMENEGAVNQDFVSILLENWKQNKDNGFSIDREGIKAVTLDMFIAGTNTTASTLEWTMAMLMKNPDIMSKLQNEVRTIGKGKTKISEDDQEKMQYLKAVFKESMRINTPTPLLYREARDDVKVMGYDIKSRTRVFINVWAIARDPALWDNPEEFRPERFVDNPINYNGLHFEYLPFGAGRRICPGMRFGMAVDELALANLVNMFDFAMPDGKTTEDLDLDGATGISVGKKSPLMVVANPHFY